MGSLIRLFADCTSASANAGGWADMIWTLRILYRHVPELLTAENIAGNIARWFVVNFVIEQFSFCQQWTCTDPQLFGQSTTSLQRDAVQGKILPVG